MAVAAATRPLTGGLRFGPAKTGLAARLVECGLLDLELRCRIGMKSQALGQIVQFGDDLPGTHLLAFPN